MRFSRFTLFVALLGCSCAHKEDNLDLLRTRAVTLPGGSQIRAEVLITPDEMQRGMMFRDPLPRGRGLLFIHQKPSPTRYWMYNVKAPLDIVFMDEARKIVEISANTPPCTTKPESCPLYGGHYYEQYVLELGSGEAHRLGIEKGQTLLF